VGGACGVWGGAASATTVEALEILWAPMSVAAALSTLIAMVWPESAPIWSCLPVKEPSSTFMPLKVVDSATRLISAISCLPSAASDPRSAAVLVSFED
jgi:hypothetical protein